MSTICWQYLQSERGTGIFITKQIYAIVHWRNGYIWDVGLVKLFWSGNQRKLSWKGFVHNCKNCVTSILISMCAIAWKLLFKCKESTQRIVHPTLTLWFHALVFWEIWVRFVFFILDTLDSLMLQSFCDMHFSIFWNGYHLIVIALRNIYPKKGTNHSYSRMGLICTL